MQLRYFDVHPGMLRPHLNGSNRVRFKAMFDLLAPGFYKKYYGSFYSGIAHGAGWQIVFRLREDKGNFATVLGNAYDENGASSVANGVVPLVLGFLNVFTKCFPANTVGTEATLEEEVEAISKWVEWHMEESKKAKPDFYTQLQAIVLC